MSALHFLTVRNSRVICEPAARCRTLNKASGPATWNGDRMTQAPEGDRLPAGPPSPVTGGHYRHLGRSGLRYRSRRAADPDPFPRSRSMRTATSAAPTPVTGLTQARGRSGTGDGHHQGNDRSAAVKKRPVFPISVVDRRALSRLEHPASALHLWFPGERCRSGQVCAHPLADLRDGHRPGRSCELDDSNTPALSAADVLPRAAATADRPVAAPTDRLDGGPADAPAAQPAKPPAAPGRAKYAGQRRNVPAGVIRD
jgi:hypothetical protein